MNDELRAACDRLRRIKDGELNVYRYLCEPPERQGLQDHEKIAVIKRQREIDEGTVIDAYLAQHPADGDELVDGGWLRSIGFDYTGQNSLQKVVNNIPVALMIGQMHAGTVRSWYATFGPSEEWPRGIKTRQDIRSLLAALGVKP